MTGGQVAALGCAIMLLLPGSYVVIIGLAALAKPPSVGGIVLAFPVALGIFVLAGFFFRIAFSRKPRASERPS